MIGESIAHYKITGKIGAGGMGEVYRASDPKLGRDVALKVLPDHLASDAERMTRFQREAQVLASLNHPNIASIYGLEESGGRRCLVLELIEGDDLSQRLKAGAIPVEECLVIARQIAEALEAAHEKGIIHRDLKPANVKITPDGAVKVLDFGLAKALDDTPGSGMTDASMSPTITSAATRAGVIMGTAAYMSPEQAKGRPVDRRSDIFSFGVVLFEMLSRSATFAGDSVSDTLAAILRVDPDWSQLPSGVPPAVVDLLRRCLEKDPKQRLQSIGEARIAIQNVMSAPARDEAGGAAAAAPSRSGPGWPAWLAGLLVAAGIGAGAAWVLEPRPPEPLPRKFAITHPELTMGYRERPVISPDGTRVVFRAGDELWVRPLDSLEAVPVPGSEGGRGPFWSPDSQNIAFYIENNLYKSPASGGQPSIIGKISGPRLDAGCWDDEGSIFVSPGTGPMFRLSAVGGDPRVILEPAEATETDFHTPFALPGGRGIIYSVHGRDGTYPIEVLSGGERKVVLRLEGERIDAAVYASSGHLVYYRHSSRNPGIWAVPFSLDSLKTTGEPFLIDPAGAWPSVAVDGTLIYSNEPLSSERQLVWVDRAGRITGGAGQPQPGMASPVLSPDGKLALVSVETGEDRDIWLQDLERNTIRRMTFDPSPDFGSTWIGNGERFIYTHYPDSSFQDPELWSLRIDGTGEPEKLAEAAKSASAQPGVPWVVFTKMMPETGEDLYYMNLDGKEAPQVFLASDHDEDYAALSPDGKYVAYVSDESGRDEVFLKRFPSAEGKWQVSVNGGRHPQWNGRGDELYFNERESASLYAVKVALTPTVTLSTPEKLFDTTKMPGNTLAAFGLRIAPFQSGERFLLIVDSDQDTAVEPMIILMQNWLAAHTPAGGI